MAKKSGRGRPPKEPVDGSLIPISMRMDPDVVRQLDEAAARATKAKGRYISRTAYVQNVLKKKLSDEEEIRSDIRDIMALCAKVVTRAEDFAGHEWHENSFVPATIGPAIQGVLAYYGDKGAVEAPEKIKELALEGQAPPSTAEEVARIIQFMVIAEFEIGANRDDPNDPGMFVRLANQNRRRAPKDQMVIPSQWAKDAQIRRGLRSAKVKKK